MAEDLAADIDVPRLWKAILNARERLKIFREKRREAVEQYAGDNWSDDGPKKEVPVNLLSLYASVVVRKLIAKNPRVMMGTFSRPMKPIVDAMETWANRRIVEMDLAGTLQRIALDALFSIGVGKVALTTPAEANKGGYQRPAGQPYFCSIDLDDMVWDTHTRCLEECSFIGHRYRAEKSVVKDSKMFDAAMLKKVEPKQDDPYNLDGDEKIGTLGQGADRTAEEFKDYVELWEIYLPVERLILTLYEHAEEPLRVQRWIGPKCGPYHFLSMGIVPGNSFPKAPVMDLVDLHRMVNRSYRKLSRQNDRQKSLLLVGASDEDAKRVTQASDGDAVRQDNPQAAKEASYGGVNQQGLGFAIHAKDVFGYIAGNLDMLGGLSPQSNTLGQDRLLEKNASSTVADMQDRVIGLTEKVIGALSWFWWNDPFHTMHADLTIPGAPDISVPRQVTPQQREQLPFEDLQLDIDPYSMAADTPGSRVQSLTQLVMQVILPAQQLLQQQGIQFNLAKFLELVAKYQNMPDLQEIITISGPHEQAPEQGGAQGGGGEPDYVSTAPSNTTRRYERVSSTAPKGPDQQLVQAAMTGSPGLNGQAA